jgi:hypothetical protein
MARQPEPKVKIEPTAYALPMKASSCVGAGARVDALSEFLTPERVEAVFLALELPNDANASGRAGGWDRPAEIGPDSASL